MRRKSVKVGAAVALIAVIGAFAFAFHELLPSTMAVQNYAIAANVRVSGAAVPRNIHAVVAAKSDINATDLQQLSPIFDITPSGPLSSPVTLTFRLNRQATKADAVIVVTQTASNGGWTLIPSLVSSDGWSVNVTASHFSNYQTWWFDLNEGVTIVKQQIADALKALTSDVVTEATPPHCANDYYQQTDAQRANYGIKSATNNTLYWCFGIENGHRILKIVNRKSYPIDVSHRGFTQITGENVTADLDQIARLVAGSQTVLFPFEEADYTVDMNPLADSVATMTTSFAGDAQSLYALQVGLTTAVSLVTEFGGGAKAATAKDVFNQVAHDMSIALTAQGCINAVRQSSLGGDFGTLISSCLTTDTMLKLFGKWGPLLVVNVFVAPLIEFFRSEFSSLVDQFTHGDLYWIIVARTGSLPTPGSGGSSGSGGGTNPPGGGSGGGTTPPPPGSIQIGWSTTHPTWIWMTLSGFAPGSYPYTCTFSTGGNGTFSVNVTSNPETIDNGHTCYDTQAGDVVWVTIGSVSSNKITVASPPPPSTYAETAGPGGSGTFTNYTNAGGILGQRVAPYETIQVLCRLTGFKVADGNTWWYRLASISPWNTNVFYASADNYYNNGATSGSLSGTPYYDSKVPLC